MKRAFLISLWLPLSMAWACPQGRQCASYYQQQAEQRAESVLAERMHALMPPEKQHAHTQDTSAPPAPKPISTPRLPSRTHAKQPSYAPSVSNNNTANTAPSTQYHYHF